MADPIAGTGPADNGLPFEGLSMAEPIEIGEPPAPRPVPSFSAGDYSEEPIVEDSAERGSVGDPSDGLGTAPLPLDMAAGSPPDKDRPKNDFSVWEGDSPIFPSGKSGPSPSTSAGPLAPRRVDEATRAGAFQPEQPAEPIELNMSTALAMVAGRNPRVAFATERYNEAYARLRNARALWLPSLRAGVSYNKHDGRLQEARGAVLDVSRASLNAGMGVQAVGTGSPAVAGLAADFHLTDAVFQPRIANRIAAATQEASRATTNDLLLDTALAYLSLLEAVQEKAIAEETLNNAQKLADLTKTFAEEGQGPQADADRAKAELVVRKNRVTRAEEQIEVAAARLNELLHMDPMTTPVAQEPTVVPIELVTRDVPIGELLATGLSNRPELEESRHLVGEAVHRYRREKYAPLLPSAFLGASYTGFGGGLGSTIGDFSDRFDFDAVVYWELRNLGFGERAARQEARSKYQQARLKRIQVMDRVAREVIQAHAQMRAREKQIATAESGVEAAMDSYRRNTQRIRAGEGLPIEVLQAIQALDQARREYLRSVVDYNEAQFRLHRALGWPIQ